MTVLCFGAGAMQSIDTNMQATPGRTKHFQTINLSDSLMLCDCPGLVFPQFSSSKAEMALAGVLPLDRLTDVRMPIGLIARRFPRAYLEALYHIVITAPMEHEDPDRPPTASEVPKPQATTFTPSSKA
jgi:large subunit GTPase 1